MFPDLRDTAPHPVGIERPGFTEGHVLPHRQRVDEAEVLVDHPDAERRSGDRVVDVVLHAVDPDRARVRIDQADEDLHQRRLARPVLTEDAVDAPAVQRQIDTITRSDRAEGLGDTAEFDGGGGCSGTRPRLVGGDLDHPPA